MHFDDRLATVLRQPARGKVIARIQYRQLLDLLGTLARDESGPQIEAAYERIEELSQSIPASERAAMLREPMVRLRNPGLLALLAQGEPVVATAAIAAARLAEEDWLDLIPVLPIRARGILRHRRDLGIRVDNRLEQLGVYDRVLPQGEYIVPLEPQEDKAGIGALVRRIEQFRKSRQDGAVAAGYPGMSADAPFLPLGDGHGEDREEARPLFDFMTGADGRISWADHGMAPMAVGLDLGGSGPEAPIRGSDRLRSLFRQRQPIDGEVVSISGAPAISGEWRADAVPSFDEYTGRFLGFCGRMRRLPGATLKTDEDTAARREADRVRQMLHELRTPANAIQMSAEVIQQQLYGPTPHEYRALAAAIAGDTARILAGFDELERLTRLDGGTLELESGQCDLVDIVSSTVTQLQAHTDPRKSGFRMHMHATQLPVGLEKIELQRLVWRLLGGLAGAAAPAEFLELEGWQEGDMANLSVNLPASLAARDDEELFHAGAKDHAQALSAGMFGLGFTLRLAMAEAKATGGALRREEDQLVLSIPLLTGPASTLSQG